MYIHTDSTSNQLNMLYLPIKLVLFECRRREQREIIGEKGVKDCWARSPEPPPLSSTRYEAMSLSIYNIV